MQQQNILAMEALMPRQQHKRSGTDHTKTFTDLVVEAGLSMICESVELVITKGDSTYQSKHFKKARLAAYELGRLWVVTNNDWDPDHFLRMYPELNEGFIKGTALGANQRHFINTGAVAPKQTPTSTPIKANREIIAVQENTNELTNDNTIKQYHANAWDDNRYQKKRAAS
jgi:hypothetical protein